MYFLPTKTLLSDFNYIQYLTIFPLIAAGIWKSRKNLRMSYNMQAVHIMFFVMLFAYFWIALPTGFTEGRMFFPALPAIIYFLFQYPFIWEEKFKLPEYFILTLVSLLLIPQFIIGFYF